MEWVWGLLAAIAVLWPGRLSGAFDGVPLDGLSEAIGIGIVLPALCWFHPRFLRGTFARGLIVALLAWKAFTSATLVQDGWCVRIVPTEQPFAKDASGVPHAWDIRADWRSPDPSCSAIMTRPYNTLSEFPVWFFNLPPPNDSWPGPRDRPPGATIAMTVTGVLRTEMPGILRILTGPDVAGTLHDDGASAAGVPAAAGTSLLPDTHRILVQATLTGDRWQFAPQWNGTDLWSTSMATVTRPSRTDLIVRPWGRWGAAMLVIALTLAWMVSAFSHVRDAAVITWMIGASAWIGIVSALGYESIARWSLVALAAATLLHLPARLRNMFGAFMLIGVPWLTLVVAQNAAQAGHFRLYEVGSDFWMYQRYAYRIVMQGYWLEGGSVTFWFQPFYRWIAGLLHVLFGESSIGEAFWDGGCVLVMALFAFAVTKICAGFRWAILAAVGTLAVYILGTTGRYIGIGLADTSSAGLLYLAALLALRSRHGHWGAALAAGFLATVAFYTRPNHLPLTLAIVVFALPLRVHARGALTPSTWLSRSTWPTVAIIWATLGAGLLFLAWRTYHYNGVFSILYGTSASRQSIWQPGMSLTSYLRALVSSVMMVLTMNDPPQFDVRALPIMAGVAISALAVAGVRRARDLPAGLVLFCLAGIVGALIARGEAYPGRFSIHLIGVTCAVVACATERLTRI